MEHRQVDEGRPILARIEPQNKYDLDVDRHNELLPVSQDGEHAKNFDNLLTSSAGRMEARDGSCT